LKRIKVAAGIIIKPDTSKTSSSQIQQVLIAKRPEHKHQGGLWEFPGGKIEKDESPERALKRELKEEINILVTQADFFQQVSFDYPDKNVILHFYLVTKFVGEPKGMEKQRVKWVSINDLEQYDFPAANQEIVNRLVDQLVV